MSNLFGEKVTKYRIDKGLSLRAFCLEAAIDAGNWSRMERGILAPPTVDSFYTMLRSVLGISIDQVDELYYFAKCARELPPQLNDEKFIERLPIFIRRIDGKEITENDLNNIISWLKNEEINELGKK